ncbi:MAG TPA: DUF401 family protein [Thermoflexia bacterium]|jgi:hypothetical protein|nr:DUF401 family protein [Thermoflexia bacterium]
MIDVLKLLSVLILTLFLLDRRWNLGWVLLLAAALLGVLFARPPLDLGRDLLTAVLSPLTLRLAAVVVFIMMLGELLRETAGLERMAEGLEGLVKDVRVVLAVWPAFIGLLPMVGGAMFSAPLVDQIGGRLKIDGARRTFVNYWFRHAWEYVFPLYPSFLLGAALLGISEHQATAALWPLFVVSLAGGVLFGLVGIRREERQHRSDQRNGLSLLARGGWPVVLVLVLTLVVHVDLLIALPAVIILLIRVYRIPLGRAAAIAWQRIPWRTVVVIFGAMAFRQTLESTGAVRALSGALTALHVPLWILLFAVPFAAGLLTGLGTGAFSIGFPIVVPLLAHNPPSGGEVAWVWAGGFLGVMLSPMHLCLALTHDYFHARLGAVYRRLLPAALLVAATGGGLLLLS